MQQVVNKVLLEEEREIQPVALSVRSQEERHIALKILGLQWEVVVPILRQVTAILWQAA